MVAEYAALALHGFSVMENHRFALASLQLALDHPQEVAPVPESIHLEDSLAEGLGRLVVDASVDQSDVNAVQVPGKHRRHWLAPGPRSGSASAARFLWVDTSLIPPVFGGLGPRRIRAIASICAKDLFNQPAVPFPPNVFVPGHGYFGLSGMEQHHAAGRGTTEQGEHQDIEREAQLAPLAMGELVEVVVDCYLDELD